MFNQEFYPTPAEVIEIMLQGETIENKTILEPSAGKGDIVDYLNEYGAKNVLTCEINQDLQKILKAKEQTEYQKRQTGRSSTPGKTPQQTETKVLFTFKVV